MSNEVSIYTDGGERPVDGISRAGWGVWYETPEGNYGQYGPCGPDSTNNIAELMAYEQALKHVLENKIQVDGFYLDSTYVLDGSQKWINGWRKRDWVNAKGEPVANVDLWKSISRLQEDYFKNFKKPKYHWVKGHTGNHGNEMADKLATKGLYAADGSNVGTVYKYAEVPATEDKDSKTKRVKKPKVEPSNPYMCLQNVLDTAHKPYMKTAQGETIYILETFSTKSKGAEDDDDQSGRKKTKKKKKESKIRNLGVFDPDMLEGLLLAKEPCPVYDSIKTMQDALIPANLPFPYLVNWQKVSVKKTWEEIVTSETTPFHALGQDIFMVDGETHIVYFLDVPRRASAAYETAMIKLDLIDSFRAGKLEREEITDLFIETSVKGKVSFKKTSEFKKVIPLPTTYKGKNVTLNVTRGVDIPELNHLKRMVETDNAKMYLVKYIPTDISFRYALIVEGDNNIAIYNSPCSSIKMVP